MAKHHLVSDVKAHPVHACIFPVKAGDRNDKEKLSTREVAMNPPRHANTLMIVHRVGCQRIPSTIWGLQLIMTARRGVVAKLILIYVKMSI